MTATATDADGNTSEFSQRIVMSTNPRSGNAGPYPITLTGFNFFPGATATVGGLPATNVVVTNYNTINLTTASLPPGSLNDITVTNTDTTPERFPTAGSSTSWMCPTASSSTLRDDARAQRDHRRRRRRQLRRRAEHSAAADGGLPAEGKVRHLLRAAAVHRFRSFRTCPAPSSFAPWINELVAQGITAGCGGGNLLPAPTRSTPADGGLPAEDVQGGGYTPPACTVASFADVPCSHRSSPTGSTSSSPATSPPAAAAATTVP